jgi:hypothetical protein
MLHRMGCDDFLLDEIFKPLVLRQGQVQSRDVAKITGTVDTITSTLRSRPPIPVSIKRKTHLILDSQPIKLLDLR